MSQGIQCVSCRSPNTGVKDSRPGTTKSGTPIIRRRRFCLDCSTRFSTIETPTETYGLAEEELAPIRTALASALAKIDSILDKVRAQAPKVLEPRTGGGKQPNSTTRAERTL